MPPRCAACPANMYADHSLRLAQEIVTKNFFLRLLRQKGKGGGKLRMIQNGGLAAGGKKIFFKLLRLGKLDKLFTHQIIKGNFPFPPPAQLQDFIYGCVTNDYLAKGIECEIIDQQNRIRLLDGPMLLEKMADWKYVSFLSYTDQTQGITLKGFVYNVENFTLKKGSTRCISNEICDEKAAVSFTNGLLYCIRSRDLR